MQAVHSLLAHPRRCALFIAIAALAAYALTLQNGFFYVDDGQFITENPDVTGADGGSAFRALLPSSHAKFLVYIPLTVMSWQLTWAIGSGSAAIFHAVDLLLHAGAAALVFWILDRLTGKRGIAFLAGLAFAVHPINAEAVVWATQRKDVLSAFFALLSFAAYIRHAETEDRKWLITSVASYGMGLLAKVGIAPLPIAFLLLDWMTGRGVGSRVLIQKAWYVLVAIPIVLVGLGVGESFVGAIGLPMTLMLGAKSVATLLGLTMFPLYLSALRWQRDDVSIADPDIAISIAVAVIFCAVAAYFIFKRNRFGLIGFGLAWFLLFLLPTFPSALKVGLLYYTSEKYAYLPLVGLLLSAASVIGIVIDRMPRIKLPATVIALSAIVAFGARTFAYVPQWRDMQTYSEYVLSSDPDNANALANLGVAAERRKEFSTARDYYGRALAANPRDIQHYLNAASLANVEGRTEDMLAILRKLVPAMTARQLRADDRLPQTLRVVAEKVVAPRDAALGRMIEGRVDELLSGGESE